LQRNISIAKEVIQGFSSSDKSSPDSSENELNRIEDKLYLLSAAQAKELGSNIDLSLDTINDINFILEYESKELQNNAEGVELLAFLEALVTEANANFGQVILIYLLFSPNKFFV
jgi:hypothetical protein